VVQSPPKAATPLPPGYHLVYMAPASLEDDLGADGTDKTFNPPGTFTRRMWAGGSMAWSKQNLLRIGEDVEEWTRLISAVPKTSRSGHEMVLVEIRKKFANSNGVALTDRSYAYVSSGAMCRCCLGVFVRFRWRLRRNLPIC
jgi:hydroxyacyl-ACP dehydratase HTD2-like protein with hotdog domain